MSDRYLSTSCQLLAHAPVCKESACQCACHLKVAAEAPDARTLLLDRAASYSRDALILDADEDQSVAKTYRIIANDLRGVADQLDTTQAGGRPASTEPAT